jgi:hypothetical protein
VPERVAGGWISKSLDAAGDVRNEHVSARESDRRRAAQPRHPNKAHAGEKEQRAPDQRDQHGLPEIGLQHEPGDGDEKQQKREGVRRHFRPPRGFAEQPGDQDDEGGLEELRGLNVDPKQDDPAPRAFDLGAELQRGGDQCKTQHEDYDRKPTDMTRRQERGRQHHGERRNQIKHMPADEIERIEAEARGNRG